MTLPHENELLRIISSDPWLMSILRAVRDVDPPGWVVGSGVVRNLVWDTLHARPPTQPGDVDVAFYDPHDLSPERDAAVELALRGRMPGIPWEAKNQAAVHLWYERRFGFAVEPLASIEQAVATWPETATAVGVGLERDDRIVLIAPLGLRDLFDMVLRRNPRRVSVEEFRRRIVDKRVRERWPRVRVMDDES